MDHELTGFRILGSHIAVYAPPSPTTFLEASIGPMIDMIDESGLDSAVLQRSREEDEAVFWIYSLLICAYSLISSAHLFCEIVDC